MDWMSTKKLLGADLKDIEGHRLNRQFQFRGLADVFLKRRRQSWQDTSTSMGEKLRQAVLSGSQDDLKHLSSVSACGQGGLKCCKSLLCIVFIFLHARALLVVLLWPR